MKKYIYSLAMLALGLSSCSSWDDPVTENYGEGPSIAINIIATTDSAVTFTLTPSEGTQFYNFVTNASDEAEELDNYTLLKGQYDNAANVKNVATDPTFTYTIKAEPNTSYQIYAVAASEKGIAGEVAVASVTTTDANAPKLVDDAFDDDKNSKSVAVTFDQNLILGEGAVSAVYYKEWDWENPVQVDADSIIVDVDGNVATFSAPSTPDGAYLAFSWDAGTFVDAKGNKCGAYTSTYEVDDEGVDFIGAWVHNANVDFTIGDSIIVAPKDLKFKDPKAFKGEIKFGFDIYRIDDELENGAVFVEFINDSKTTINHLTPDQWSVKDSVLTFTLPEGIQGGDLVRVGVVDGVIYDVYGNTNKGFTSKTTWKYVTFTPTAEDVLGTFTYYTTLKSDGKTYKLGDFTISEYTGEDAEEGDVVISNLYLDGSEIYGYYDLAEAKLYVWRYQELGTYEDKGVTYGVLTYNLVDATDAKLIEFDITEEGIVSNTFALAQTDAAYEELLDFEIPVGSTLFVKATPAETSRSTKVARFAGNNKFAKIKSSVKGTPKKAKQIRK